MTVETTLLKVDADLRAGRIPVARQRLRGLVGSYPADLTARRRLAEVYRLYGEPVEAGRWAYLEADRDPDETAAFEARYSDPLARMAAVRWYGSERLVETETARARLVGLREAASAHAGSPVYWHTVGDHILRRGGDGAESASEDDGWLGCVGLVAGALVLLAFAVLGVVTFVRWLL
ncbi:DUF6584 family protein [Kitasatospora sp. NPDC051853]|uniref:DUF6584 family protein n=1 Tax=Kitasatospora sp. NPDC051853 TaxID=3364058 RepID=UPI0037B29CAF